MATGWVVLIAVIALLVGGRRGLFPCTQIYARLFQKNPPVNEDMLRMMMASMGQKPSEKKVRQMMQQMKNQGK